MIGLLADSSGLFSFIFDGGGIGLSGPVGLSDGDGGDAIGLSGGVGLTFDASAGLLVGLNDGVGLFA